MGNLNPCVTGDTKVLTVNGLKTFDELASSGDDVDVYSFSDELGVVVSKMLHPRITGYNVEIVKVTLEDGTVLKSSCNHEYLTKDGYVPAEDLMEGDLFPSFKDICSSGMENELESPYAGTKKGTVIKKCEVSGEEFEATWETREICVKEGYEKQMSEKMDGMKAGIKTLVVGNIDESCFIPVSKVEFLDKRENVYIGTVAGYHNYFTVDETTDTMVNQMNCGE